MDRPIDDDCINVIQSPIWKGSFVNNRMINGRFAKVVVLADGNRGRNSRSLSNRPHNRRVKKAKRQGNPMGNKPYMSRPSIG